MTNAWKFNFPKTHLAHFFINLDNAELLRMLPTYGIQLVACASLYVSKVREFSYSQGVWKLSQQDYQMLIRIKLQKMRL
jgi:hypothetical protein